MKKLITLYKSLYKYNYNLLLKNPTKYQYSKFYGKDFFQSYKLSRDNFLKSIQLKLPKKSNPKD